MRSGLGRGGDISERPPARGRQEKRVRRHHGPGGGRARRYGHRNHGTARRTAKVTRCEGGRRTDAGEGAKASRKQAQQKGNDLPSCTPPADTDSILHASFPLFPRKNKSGPCPDSRLGAAFFTFVFRRNACIFTASPAACGILTGVASLPAPLLTAAVDPPRFL